MNAPAAPVIDAALPARRWRYWTWPVIVVGLLLGHLSIMVTAVVLATGDKSFAVLPNYYERAVNWDKHQAELRASEKLGWQVTVIPSPKADPTGRRALTVTVADAVGRSIAGAAVELTWYHPKRPNELHNAALRTDPAGRASETVVMRGEGFYQVSVTVTAGGRRFMATLTPFVSNAKGAPA